MGIQSKPVLYQPAKILRGSVDMNEHSSSLVLRQVIGLLLAHSGFDGEVCAINHFSASSEAALATLLDICANFFHKLGRTMHVYSEKYGNSMDSAEILLHSLLQNGLSDVANLEFYMRHDIQQYGNKLSDLSYRLQTAYHDIDLVWILV